jgi:hypothetical protein
MLGPAKSRRLGEPIAVSLENLVPANNFYRHLEAKLDLGFVREWVTEHYAERGRPSIPGDLLQASGNQVLRRGPLGTEPRRVDQPQPACALLPQLCLRNVEVRATRHM